MHPQTQQIPVGDTQWNVCQAGDGPPLLLVHGFPLDHTMWQAQIEAFGDDYQVIAPDLRGFGGSPLGTQPLSLGGLADDLAALLTELNVTRPIIFCGLSMGGYIAWQFWDRHRDRLDKLILCDTRAAADTAEAAAGRRETARRVLAQGTESLIEGMLPKLFAESTRNDQPKVVDATRQVMAATDSQSVAAALLAMAERPDWEPRLAEISVPALLLCGAHDVITPPEEMQRVADTLPASEFIEIPSAGHMAPLEQPAAVNRAIASFLGHGG